ncbi:hypothetical protein [Mucilaginibacter aquaedulcis]|uniref:hypothetical protein n=1 Tax=Mucilaginibacter aquaedulcis TaxID=1187081 RepID=UPI0025B4C1CE|nr:hypothetical protein [Mucilaginibacter aquaedulcis]MDN3548775.1 hypothetical protein [Mucilaginibacter aquaedulcis]
MAASSSNFISLFAPQSHFFTDPAVVTQSAVQAFGPASPNIFHTTSSFNITADALAFAICSGVVSVQPQTGNNNLVNLILRPFKQPIIGINIKYFIYRGLKKVDFFNGDKVIQPRAGTSDFVNRINTAFDSYYAANPKLIKPDFLAKFIGFDPVNQPDNSPISDLFFKQSEYVTNNGNSTETTQTSFELPMMPAGASLGRFAVGECGLDIVLNYGDYQLPASNDQFVFDLAYARDNDYSIDLTQITDAFQRKLTKEQIFQFLDVAAYFGFHCTDQGTVTVNNNGTKVKKTGQAIYTDVIQNFQTRNNLYLYIQSDRTRSYNFYENYGMSDTDDHSLLWGYTETSLSPSIYSSNGWPLIIDNAAQSHNETSNRIYLQLVTDNNVNTMLYGQIGRIENAQSNNFCGADSLKSTGGSTSVSQNLTRTIILTNPNTGSDGAKLNIASFNILIYQGVVYDYISAQVTDAQAVTTNTFAQPALFDDIFDLINARPLFKTDQDAQYSSFTSQKLKLINHYYDNTQYGISAVQTSIVNDTIDTGDTTNPRMSRVTYITDSIDILNNVVANAGRITADTKSSPSVSASITGSKTYQLPNPFYFDIKTFTESSQNIVGIKLLSTERVVPSKVLLGITKNENDQLKNLIITAGLINSSLFLINLYEDGSALVSTENILYQKYYAGVVGETLAGELKLAITDNSIIIYSLDKTCYFSKGYSDFIKDTPITTLFLDLEISI